MHGDQGADVIYAWSGGAAYGDNGKDELYQYAGSATLDGGNGGDTLTNGNDPTADPVTLSGGRGSDTLVNAGLDRNDRHGRRPGAGLLHRGTTEVDCES